MSEQIINIGSAANDGTGDTYRVAHEKAKNNFNELYNSGDLTGSAVFKKPNGDFIGSDIAPLTGAIPIDLTAAINGGFCGIYYSGPVINSLSYFTGATKVFLSGVNVLDELCIIWLVYNKTNDLIIATIQTGTFLGAAAVVETSPVITLTDPSIVETSPVITLTDP